MTDRVRVLTYNLLSRQRADGAARQRVVARGLADLRPDVVAFQEVTNDADGDQAAQLLGPDFTVVAHPNPSADGVGACLGSRWPVGAVDTLDLRLDPDGGLPWAAAVAVEIRAPEPLGTLLVVHHKPNWELDREHLRERQAVAVARFVEELVVDRAGLPVILLGDLDAGPDAASVRFLTGRQSLAGVSVRYEDAWEAVRPGEPGHTFSPRNPLVSAGEMPLERGRRIDHVLVRGGRHGPTLEVADCRLAFDEPVDGVWPSDHFGVLVELRRPDHPPGDWA